MKKVAVITVTAAMLTGIVTGCTPVEIEPSESETSVVELGPARAQDDYYRFVNQERFDTAEFEYGSQSVEMAFDSKLIEEQLNGIIEETVAGSGYAKGSEEDLIKYAYDSFMAYDFDNEPIPSDLMAVMDEIDNASSVDELIRIDAKLVRDYGMSGMFCVEPDIDPFDPQRKVLTFTPAAGMLRTTFIDIRDDAYALDYVMEDARVILTARGYDKEAAEQYGRELAYITLDLYTATDMELADTIFPYEYMKIVPAEQVKEILGNVDLDGYLTLIGYDTSKINDYCLSDEGQLRAINAMLKEENLNALKAMELGEVFIQYSRYIAPHYPQLKGMIGRSYDSLHDQAVDEVRTVMGAETDPIYVEQYYTPEMDKALRDMCDDIRAGYRDLISVAEWLSEPTRKELLRKLENIVYVTGSNLERHDNSKYANVYGNNYYEFRINYMRLEKKELIDSLNEPVSRTDLQMPMQMFNACYNASLNNITITAAITNKPFFDVDADYYTNLGGLGMVIAHEMGHAFDSTCIVFNADAQYDPSWIPDADMQTLLERNEKAIRYFEDNFTVFGIYHVDGEQTLGENYADLGALECVTSLCKTNDDRVRLFENYATIWCEMCTDDCIIEIIAYDTHSPAYIRVNAVLGTVDAFYETYYVKEGDGMYIAPEDRISRWY